MAPMKMKMRNPSDRSNESTATVATGNADQEYFWACELSDAKPTLTWKIDDDDLEDDDEDYIEHSLFVRSVCLGAGAVDKQDNIVTMQSSGHDGEVFTGTVANLCKGVNSMTGNLSITVDGKSGVTFKLAEGTGPVSICGNHQLVYPNDYDLDTSQTGETSLEEDEEEEEDEEMDKSLDKSTDKKSKATKRKAPAKVNKQKQKAKMEEDDDEDEEDEDEDEEESDEEEDSEEDTKTKKGNNRENGKKGAAKKPAPVKEGKKPASAKKAKK